MSFRVLEAAKDDAWEIGTRYAVHDMSKALRFSGAFDDAVARIAADPTSFPPHPEMTGPRERYVAGFPHVVLFRTADPAGAADPAGTVALGVVHTSAGPDAYRRVARRG